MQSIKNSPDIWKTALPVLRADMNKYDRGHIVILGGTDMTGAARLAADASMRAGCGVCTIVSSEDVKAIYLEGSPHIMFESYKDLSDFPAHLTDRRRNACIMGPGAGRKNDGMLRQAVLAVLKMKKPVVLDADALNIFEDRTEDLFHSLHDQCILTPHEGEFSRLFPSIEGSRQERASQAAQITGAVVLLKGAETFICMPNGNMIINDHSTPLLATAGSGDVLAGIIGGLLAQGMKPDTASAAAAWIHGEAALQFGAGLTAPDIIAKMPQVFKTLSGLL